MIIVDKFIKSCINHNDLISNYKNINEQTQPGSFDLRIDDEFMYYEKKEVLDPYEENELITRKVDDTLIIEPKQFLLASTIEKVNIPYHLSAKVDGKSTIGRLGLHIENAGWIDSGFSGQITLELYNANSLPIKIHPGMAICQIVFFKNNELPEIPYQGKYTNQSGVTAPRIQKHI